MALREYLTEKLGMPGASLKLNNAEAASQKLFAYLVSLVDEIEREVEEIEGRKIQIQGQKVKIKSIELEVKKLIENLKRFAQRIK